MRVPALLPDPHLVRLDYIAPDATSITLVVTTSRSRVTCPDCGHPAARIHSHYRRTVADLPWNGVQVRLRLQSRKFFCDQPECDRRIFTERLPGLVQRYARRTVRLAETLRVIGYALSGEAGARMAAGLGLVISPDALLERVRQGGTVAGQPRGCLALTTSPSDEGCATARSSSIWSAAVRSTYYQTGRRPRWRSGSQRIRAPRS